MMTRIMNCKMHVMGSCKPLRAATLPYGVQARPRPSCMQELRANGCSSHQQQGKPTLKNVGRRNFAQGLIGTFLGAKLLSEPASALSAPPPPAVQQAADPNQVQALIALLDGQEALTSALRVKGSQGGSRLRLRNLLPKYSAAVQTMTAYLPAAIAGVPGPEDDEEWVNAANNILIGTSQVVAMARFATKGEFENFTDADIPYSDIDLATKSIAGVLSNVPDDTLEKAVKGRCRRRLNAAKDLEEMKELANSSVCSSGM